MTTRENNTGYPHYEPIIEEWTGYAWRRVSSASLHSPNGRMRRMGDTGYPHYTPCVQEFDGYAWVKVD